MALCTLSIGAVTCISGCVGSAMLARHGRMAESCALVSRRSLPAPSELSDYVRGALELEVRAVARGSGELEGRLGAPLFQTDVAAVGYSVAVRRSPGFAVRVRLEARVDGVRYAPSGGDRLWELAGLEPSRAAVHDPRYSDLGAAVDVFVMVTTMGILRPQLRGTSSLTGVRSAARPGGGAPLQNRVLRWLAARAAASCEARPGSACDQLDVLAPVETMPAGSASIVDLGGGPEGAGDALVLHAWVDLAGVMTGSGFPECTVHLRFTRPLIGEGALAARLRATIASGLVIREPTVRTDIPADEPTPSAESCADVTRQPGDAIGAWSRALAEASRAEVRVRPLDGGAEGALPLDVELALGSGAARDAWADFFLAADGLLWTWRGSVEAAEAVFGAAPATFGHGPPLATIPVIDPSAASLRDYTSCFGPEGRCVGRLLLIPDRPTTAPDALIVRVRHRMDSSDCHADVQFSAPLPPGANVRERVAALFAAGPLVLTGLAEPIIGR